MEDKATRSLIIRLLSSSNENTLVSTLTTLFYLLEYPQGVVRMIFIDFLSPIVCQKKNVSKAIHTYATCDNPRIANVATSLEKQLHQTVTDSTS